MDDESINNQWNSSTSFILVMVGSIIALAGIWRFSYLIYENGGGSFLIPYILSIVILAIPLLVLEFGVGFKYKASLPRIFYNIKSEFEIVAWFILFLIFLVLIYYTCIMSWDLIYVVLSLFKGWGNNPSVFFSTTLLHSTSNPYGLTYLVVPIGIALAAIWALIYFISRKEINKGISLVTKFSLALTFILIIILSIFALQLPGSRTGLMALFNPNWEYLLDFNIWLTAFGQLIFSYGLAYGIASTYASYLPEDIKLVDSAWIIVVISLIFEILMSVLIFALLGHMALGKNIPITSLVSDGFSLIFVVFPNVFNVIGSWANLIAPAFFLLLFVGGLGALFALMEPLANAVSEKFLWTRDRALKTLVLVGLFSSFLFATGMGEYLLRIVDSFINQFAIVLVVLLEMIVFGWLFDLEDIRNLLNDNSRIKLGKYWIYLIKFIIPILLIVIWIMGIYNLILSGDRQTLLIQSILASIIVLVPLALTVIPFKGDYSLDLDNRRYNYFKDIGDDSKSESAHSKSKSGHSKSKSGQSLSRSKDDKKYIEKTIDDFEDYGDEEDASHHKSIFNWDKFKRSKNGKNVLNNVDLSSKEFDSPGDEDDEYYDYDVLDNVSDVYDGAYDGFDDGVNNYKSRKSNGSESKSNSKSQSKVESKSLFEKINLFNKDFGDDSNAFDDDSDESSIDYSDGFSEGSDDYSDEELEMLFNESSRNGKYHDYNGNNDFYEDYENYDGEFDYIAPIREENSNSGPKKKRTGKKHQFRSSKDFEDIGSLDDLGSNLDEEKPKEKSKPKRKSKSWPESESKSVSESESKSEFRSEDNFQPKSKPKKSFRKLKLDLDDFEGELDNNSAKEDAEEKEEIEYEDFTDDFFDDGVFGEEGYESLLDDYVKPKPKKKSKKKSSSESDKPKDSKPYYDFEKKGADSVFNLDD